MNDEQLQRHLQSFTDLKILLIKNETIPASSMATSNEETSTNVGQQPTSSTNAKVNETFSNDTIFCLNHNFSGKRIKFKMTVPPPKEVQVELFFWILNYF